MADMNMTALLKEGEAESLRRQKTVQWILRVLVWAAAAITIGRHINTSHNHGENTKNII